MYINDDMLDLQDIKTTSCLLLLPHLEKVSVIDGSVEKARYLRVIVDYVSQLIQN